MARPRSSQRPEPRLASYRGAEADQIRRARCRGRVAEIPARRSRESPQRVSYPVPERSGNGNRQQGDSEEDTQHQRRDRGEMSGLIVIRVADASAVIRWRQRSPAARGRAPAPDRHRHGHSPARRVEANRGQLSPCPAAEQRPFPTLTVASNQVKRRQSRVVQPCRRRTPARPRPAVPRSTHHQAKTGDPGRHKG